MFRDVNRREKIVTQKLETEEKVVLLDVMDHYHGLTKKLKYSLKWAYESIDFETSSHPNSSIVDSVTPKWVLKIDDDVILRAKSYEENLINRYPNTKYLYFGRFQFRTKPVLKEGKWAEKKYQKDHYPVYAEGNTGYTISTDILKYLIQNFKNIKEYQNEDASMGIWLDDSPFREEVSYRTSKRIRNIGFKMPDLCVEGKGIEPRYSKSTIVLGHRLRPFEIWYCWEAMFGRLH